MGTNIVSCVHHLSFPWDAQSHQGSFFGVCVICVITKTRQYVTLEGLAKLCEENPFQCAIMCRNVDEMEGG